MGSFIMLIVESHLFPYSSIVPVGDTQWDSLSERALFTAQKYSISNMVNAYEELYADIFR